MEEAAIGRRRRPARARQQPGGGMAAQSEDVLVKDELKVNPRLADFFDAPRTPGELQAS